MAVGFAEIPAGGALRSPLFYAELDATRSNQGARLQKTLIVAQMLASGTAAAGVPALNQGEGWADGAFGVGSQAALMVRRYRKRDTFGPVYVLPLADDAGSTAATGAIAVTGAPTAAGSVAFDIAGVRVNVALSASMTTAQVAAAIGAAVTAMAYALPVTAAVSTSTVTLTARNKGLGGNEIAVTLNPEGEAMPAGFAATVPATLTGGAVNPVAALTTALAGLGDDEYDFIAFPYTDAASLDALKAHMASRWAYNRQLYGHAFAFARGNFGALTTFGTARNDEHVTVFGGDSMPEPGWLLAAAFTASMANSLRADPALPLHFLAVDAKAPPVGKRFGDADRNALLFSGISPFTVDADGTVRTSTVITGKRVNAAGNPDDSLLHPERLYTVAHVLRDLRTTVTSVFGRVKLADDGTKVAAGARVVTPRAIKAAIARRYEQLEAQGLVQNSAQFAAALIVERDGGNRCRVNGLLPIVPVDALRQVAVVAQLRNAAGLEG